MDLSNIQTAREMYNDADTNPVLLRKEINM